EGHGGFSEVHNLWGIFDPTLPNPATKTPGAILFGANSGRSDIMASVNNVFLPRVGFAWTLKSQWSVRGGFGIYTSLWSIDVDGSPLGFGTARRGAAARRVGGVPRPTQATPRWSFYRAAAQTCRISMHPRMPAPTTGKEAGIYRNWVSLSLSLPQQVVGEVLTA